MRRPVARSKYAVDLFYRIWDSANSGWVVHQSRSVWSTRSAPTNIIEKMVAAGRNPDTLNVERVYVSVAAPGGAR